MLIFILIFISFCASECPDGWTLRPGSSFCYKSFDDDLSLTGTSWTVAESTCNSYGGDLVSFEDVNEQNWVYNIMNWNQNDGSWRFYWLGKQF